MSFIQETALLLAAATPILVLVAVNVQLALASLSRR